MRRLILFLLLSSAPALAQGNLFSVQKFCEVGGQKVLTSGLQSSNEMQRSFPNCTVTVYATGTTNLATIYADNLSTPTPLANPFTALTNGSFLFYVPAACYDIITSGGNSGDQFPTPYTYWKVCAGQGGGGGGGGGGTVLSVGLSAPTGFPVSGSPVTSNGTLTWAMPTGWSTGSLLLGIGPNAVAALGIGSAGTCLTSNGTTVSWGAAPCIGIPPGTTNQVIKYTNGPASLVGNSSLFDDGTTPTQAPNGLSTMSNANYYLCTNDTVTGTVTNQLVQFGSTGCINASSASTSVIGVADVGAGTSGTAQIAHAGIHPVVFDGQTVVGDVAIPSGTAGLASDGGASAPLGVQRLGRIITLNSGAGTPANVIWFTGDILGTTTTPMGVINPCASSPGPLAYYTAALQIGCDLSALTDGNGNLTAVSGTFTGTGAGFTYLTQGAAPTLSVANSWYWYAPTTITTTVGNVTPAAIGSSGQCLGITGVVGQVQTWGYVACSGAGNHVCNIRIGADNGNALGNTDIAPQGRECLIAAASTVKEVDVTADAGTPSVVLSRNHAGSATAILSSALSTATAGAPACSNVGGTTGIDGVTTCSATLQNTAIAAGDYLETTTATAGGTAKRMTIAITFTSP